MRNKPTTENANKFLAKKPTFISRVRDCDLYECPTYGDERPLWAITPQGKLKQTEHWEAPSHHDAEDLIHL